MLASCAVLDKTHDEAIAFLGVNYNGWNLCLAKLHERLDPTLATNKIVACPVSFALAGANCNRSLQADLGDTLHDLLKIAPIAEARI
jgi:hypothetical protein